MHGKVMMAEQVNHNYGMTTTTRIEGTDIVFKEVFKKITPKTSGYFTFESEVGLAGVMKNLGFPAENIGAMTTNSSFRNKDLGDGAEVIEYFGGEKKLVSFKYNEEFDYDRPGKTCQQSSSQAPP